MTYAELVNLIETNLTRVGNNRVSAPEIKQVCQAILDFAAAIDNADAIPTWTNLLTFQTDGSGAGKYCKHADVNGKLRIFETKIANNLNNVPPTDPNITENANWKEISASAGSGIQEWAPGLYGAGLVIVYHNHSTDGRGLYILLDPVRPFNSTNIETETTALKWEKIGGSGKGIAKVYADIASLLADQAQQKIDFFYFVTDASADATVDAGWAVYQKLAPTTGAIGDYRKLSEQESLDILHATEGEVVAGTNSSKTVTPLTLAKTNQAASHIVATASGTNTYAAIITPALIAYVSLSRFFVRFTNGNTGPATLNFNSLGPIPIKKNGTTDLSSGDIQPGQILCLAYDGTNFQVMGFYGLNITQAEKDAIPAGETNLFTVTKSIDGTMISYGAGVRQIDNFAGGSLSTLLADTAAWNGDTITLTGDNLNGALGQTAQEYVITNSLGTIYKCVTHATGTTSANGSATWIRTRSRDNLAPGTAQDDSIIAALSTESGWNATDNTKIITTRSRVGTWHRGLTGYFYACISETTNTNWTWIRIGQPDAQFVDISDATLISEIEANNFSTTPILTPVAATKGLDMQRHYWETAGPVPNLAVCVNKGTAKWIKIK